ncbi:cytochrome b [Halomonas sp. MCCC 1A11036]|uniref:Cytochrome b n=1 Tax=Billgrantia zhangzhouensis TaxID=2733481 RepID=A0ABS9AI00_9GAMM|nr:cytochrome b/b6 domain-containing protein [Halomonas zhangzhouensis]MCE8021292.1 cytochrome b [Halomonas zhangzhouensis]
MNRRSPHPSPWRDTPDRYGRISRILHWLTAGQVTLLFTVTLAWKGAGENAVTLLLARIGPHGSLGAMLLLTTLLRAIWAYSQRHHRPPRPRGLAGVPARCVHLAFYVLLILIPAMAILRQYGRGGHLLFYGMELLPEAERDIPWMVAPADLLHSTLAWLLLGLIVGHVAMALVHRLWREDAVFSRLTGPLDHRGHAPAHPDAHRAGSQPD